VAARPGGLRFSILANLKNGRTSKALIPFFSAVPKLETLFRLHFCFWWIVEPGKSRFKEAPAMINNIIVLENLKS
jgi:hypothetical protein